MWVELVGGTNNRVGERDSNGDSARSALELGGAEMRCFNLAGRLASQPCLSALSEFYYYLIN